MAETTARYRLGVDVGGTHTDLVLLDAISGDIRVEKVASTPANPADGVLGGVKRFLDAGVDPGSIGFFAHGTTITTNALLEMRGARVGLMITAGFNAIQETQTQARDGNPFDYFYDKPPAIAPQSRTVEIPERVDYAGSVLTPLDEDAVAAGARRLAADGVEAIAVNYLFSYMNPAHERRSREIIHEAAPGIHVSLASDVLPRIREWPRLSTTLVNAYLAPVLTRYIANLAKGLDDLGIATPQRFLMQSNGGVMPFAAAMEGENTVHTLLSGPAAGARAAAWVASDGGARDLVTLDMGGTSADIAFIEGGTPLEVTEGTVARRQVDVPALDMTTISAGGGSIAKVEAGAFLTVGPESAGADPGPACYGQGGTAPTVTDADIACGFLNPDYFLGGSQSLDVAAAETALEGDIAQPLNLAVREAAAGIRRIVDERMADEVRVFAAKRGLEPREFTLLPFGGAGAVHAAAVASELGIARILVPPRPGAFSALGLLCSDVVHDFIRSELKPITALDPDHGEALFAELETRARAELAAEGLAEAEAGMVRELDMRYAGQGYELRVPLDGLGTLDGAALAEARRRFDKRHEQIHGHAAREKEVEVVSYRIRATVSVPKFEPRAQGTPETAADPGAALKGRRMVWFDGLTGSEAPVYERERLTVGARLTGPAIVEQMDATTVIPAGWRAEVDAYGNLILEAEGGA
ncbi:MAG: hydantoinase/oxoprolinase family protein [Alphaproteobacteria bacterium]|nr:hydantoinase/oxoprolinase family protein [Alphaproteobacteria bacterium]